MIADRYRCNSREWREKQLAIKLRLPSQETTTCALHKINTKGEEKYERKERKIELQDQFVGNRKKFIEPRS